MMTSQHLKKTHSNLLLLKICRKLNLSALAVVAVCMALSVQAASDITTQHYSGINQVQFHEAQQSKDFVGNGFLIRHNNKTYAVTVKHALLEMKSPKLTSVYIQNQVKEWRIHPNKSQNEYVLLGRLINENSSEAIDMQVLSKDWLVFEVKENHSKLAVFELRNTPLKVGENVTAYGCSYANKKSCKQDEYNGAFIEYDQANLRVNMPDLDLSKLRGLSGSPVLDANQKVVGIVSNVMKSKDGNGFDFAPASLDYLKSVLDSSE